MNTGVIIQATGPNSEPHCAIVTTTNMPDAEILARVLFPEAAGFRGHSIQADQSGVKERWEIVVTTLSSYEDCQEMFIKTDDIRAAIAGICKRFGDERIRKVVYSRESAPETRYVTRFNEWSYVACWDNGSGAAVVQTGNVWACDPEYARKKVLSLTNPRAVVAVELP